MESDVVPLSQRQFTMTALHHLLFVLLMLGPSAVIGIMERVDVVTGRVICRDVTKF